MTVKNKQNSLLATGGRDKLLDVIPVIIKD